MRDGFVSIDWSAQPLSFEARLVIQKMAVFLMRLDQKRPWIDFTHLLVEGRITHKGSGVFVSIPGNFFHADMGMVRGEKWTLDFLIRHGAEDIILNDDMRMAVSWTDSDGRNGQHVVDRSLVGATEASLLL